MRLDAVAVSVALLGDPCQAGGARLSPEVGVPYRVSLGPSTIGCTAVRKVEIRWLREGAVSQRLASRRPAAGGSLSSALGCNATVRVPALCRSDQKTRSNSPYWHVKASMHAKTGPGTVRLNRLHKPCPLFVERFRWVASSMWLEVGTVFDRQTGRVDGCTAHPQFVLTRQSFRMTEQRCAP